MGLPRNLLAVAKDLAVLDPRRPRQAALRRAVSTAYYALFHLLIGDAAESMLANSAERAQLGPLVRRDFGHDRLKNLAINVSQPQGSRGNLGNVLTTATPDADLLRVAAAFVFAHEQRELADYNVGRRFGRAGVLALILWVEQAFGAWERVKTRPDGRLFLIAMLLYARGRN